MLAELVKRIVEADTWDEAVYQCRPDDDWVLVHRTSWAAIRQAVDDVDTWRPWGDPNAHPSVVGGNA